MRFLKKLFETIISWGILAALAGGIWYFYGDYITSQVKYLIQIVETMEEDSQYSEQTAAIKEILESSYTNFSNQNLVECKTFEICPGYDENDADIYYEEVVWDRAQDIIRRELHDPFYVLTFVQGPYNEDTYLSDSWTRYTILDGQPREFEIIHFPNVDTREVYTASSDIWYYHLLLYHYADFRKGEYSDLMPYALLRKLEMKDYEIAGTEEYEGQQAIHYIVTHKPLMRKPGVVMEEQYEILNEDGSVTKCSPIEYFEAKIDPRVRENYPEFYASFMELVDKRYYQDNKTHFWITEDGTLLGIESDWTFESYYGTLIYADFETISERLESVSSETGELFYADFAQLMPVTRVAVFKYGDEVEPVTIPEECESLAE